MFDTEERNVVTVNIFGQEYTISGEMSRDAIMKVADYVNSKMTEIGGESSLPASRVAILSAMDITGELFEEQKNHKENERYQQMWEEVKASYIKARDDLNAAAAQKDDLIRQNGEKDQQLANLYNELAEVKKHNETLRGRVEELTNSLEYQQSLPDQSAKKIEELEAKCRDIESSFFDIQMENIRLKNENETLKKQRY
jgi:cell division protein ZapA